jgi:hypothetical protein
MLSLPELLTLQDLKILLELGQKLLVPVSCQFPLLKNFILLLQVELMIAQCQIPTQSLTIAQLK